MTDPPRGPAGHLARGDGERLQKVLARMGFGSRRACDELIASGRVLVDGSIAVLGQRIEASRARVQVDGVAVSVAPALVYYLMNKPAGTITAASDVRGRPVVTELVPSDPRVFPVGRLDMATEGLLILTNDGELAHAVAHPSGGVEKEYVVELAATPRPGELRQLRRGVLLEDGITAPARVGVIAPGVLRITLHEGRNRQVRRMCEAVGYRVQRLVRTRIGPITDSTLAPGKWRTLRPAEVRALAVAAQGLPRPSPGPASQRPRSAQRSASSRTRPGSR